MTDSESNVIFSYWKNNIQKEYGKAKFQKMIRKEILRELFDLFRKSNIDKVEARYFKTNVIKFLVTLEGSKGTGKHKGWKENVSGDYDMLMLEYYPLNQENNRENHVIPNIPDQKLSYNVVKKPTYGDREHMPKNDILVAWTKQKFLNDWTESLSLEAHRIKSQLQTEFKNQLLKGMYKLRSEEYISLISYT